MSQKYRLSENRFFTFCNDSTEIMGSNFTFTYHKITNEATNYTITIHQKPTVVTPTR